MKPEDKTLGRPKQTSDYSIFKKLPGNRETDPRHVRLITKSILTHGNLTANFPVIVNERMEVIDGQHRIEALKELGWPVFYRIEPHLNIDNVRAINQAGANWNWHDYAESFAKLGNVEYKNFLDLHSTFGFGYSVLSWYASTARKSKGFVGPVFSQGEMVIPNLERTKKLLKQYQEVSALLNFNKPDFAKAMHKVMVQPEYQHARMLHKAQLSVPEMTRQAGIAEYVLAIEKIYNWASTEENRVRFTY